MKLLVFILVSQAKQRVNHTFVFLFKSTNKFWEPQYYFEITCEIWIV